MSLVLLGRGVIALAAAVIGGSVIVALLMAREVRADVKWRREQRMRGERRG